MPRCSARWPRGRAGSPAPPPADGEILAHLLDGEVALATFSALRADTLGLVRRLAPAQRRASGRHPAYGRLRISQLLDHGAEHDLVHLEQIQSTLKQLAGR